jgi:hypothetical protein
MTESANLPHLNLMESCPGDQIIKLKNCELPQTTEIELGKSREH